MQIMPATWRYLVPRYGLGADPLDARMNMIGGALYLAELARRFGWPGAFAAYNAGPARYARYATHSVPLPAETAAYVARLGGVAATAVAANPATRWQDARLFVSVAANPPDAGGARDVRFEVPPRQTELYRSQPPRCRSCKLHRRCFRFRQMLLAPADDV